MFWIWLTTIPYVGPVMRNRLIQYFKTPELIYYADSVELSKVEGIRKKQVCSILENHSLKRAYEILQRCEDDDIQMMTVMDAIYPDRAIIDGKSSVQYHFPQRNRLISAWSDQLVVIAAGERSGALITADFSREYGRKVDMMEE